MTSPRLHVLPVLLAVVLLPAAARAQSAPDSALPQGLVLHNAKTSYRGTALRPDRIVDRTLSTGEAWVDSPNPRILALGSYAPESFQLVLTTLRPDGSPRATWQPPSHWTVIPRDADLLWVVGKERGEGFLQADGKVPYAGLHAFTPDGAKLITLDAAITGAIGAAQALPDGSIAVLGTNGLQRFAADGTLLWAHASNAHTLKLLGSGSILATESWDPAGDRRAIRLLDVAGAELLALEDSNTSHLAVLAASDAGASALVARLVGTAPVRWELSLRDLRDGGNVVQTLEVAGGPEHAALSRDGRTLAVALNEPENGTFRRRIRAFTLGTPGQAATELFSYDPPADDFGGDRLEIRDGILSVVGSTRTLQIQVTP